MENESRSEIMRQLQELGLSCVKKYRCRETKYLHYSQDHDNETPSPMIPILENFLMILTLLRSRTVENISDAKEMLEKILHFQVVTEQASHANFPVYLHEYPECKDRFSGLHISLVIYWILKSFHAVIGSDLHAKLAKSLQSLLLQALKTHHEKPAPYHFVIKLACVAAAGGKLLQDDSIGTEGNTLLQKMSSETSNPYWYNPESMAVMLVSLSLVYPHIANSPWKKFWHHVQDTWHHAICSYIGPALKEWQYEFEPKTTLYDLILGYYSGSLSARSLKIHPVHFQAALIHPSEEIFVEPKCPLELEGNFNEMKWFMHRDKMAYSAISYGQKPLVKDPAFYPFTLTWGNSARLHSFVCESNPDFTLHVEKSPDPNKVCLTFTLEKPAATDDREKSREITFFLDFFSALEFRVETLVSSTFRLGELITIKGDRCLIHLKFSLLQGTGTFMGHRMLGNRPSQIAAKGLNRYQAYDWMIFLRTVNRSAPCQVLVELSYTELTE